jgi:alkanesulfonate monooxygenase SsuD/methylene tetrahydromethanopterin reductase-like flavin-dependent oxidoreductase (luciferase family)
MWGPTIPILKQRFESFQAAATKVDGRPVKLGAHLALLRDTYVADTMEQARRESEKSIVESYQWILGRRGRARVLNPGEALSEDMNLDFDFLFPRNLLVGTPNFVIDKIHELRETLNLEHLFIWTSQARMPHTRSMRSLELFAEKVMPAFAD